MNRLTNPFLFIFCLFFSSALMAQDYNIGNVKASAATSDRDNQHKMNYIKLNLTSIPLNNYGLQYERILNRRFSVALSGRLMPESGIPFKSAIIKKVEPDDQDMIDLINDLRLSNYAITPEVKLYAGKGYGQGFYVGFFYRYSSADLKGFPLNFEDETGNDKTLDLTGNMTSHTGGILLGLQKNIGRSLALDLWFLGPHVGGGKGNLTGVPNSPLTPLEQQNAKEALEDIDIPMVNSSYEVSANKVALKVDGPWAGLRMGITFGVRF